MADKQFKLGVPCYCDGLVPDEDQPCHLAGSMHTVSSKAVDSFRMKGKTMSFCAPGALGVLVCVHTLGCKAALRKVPIQSVAISV